MVEEVTPLVCSPSPRDIPDVKKAWNTLPYDKLFAKYYLEQDAYRLLQEYFMDHEQYNYMVIAPDDLVLNRDGFDRLVWDLEQYRYPALAGVCNFSYHDRTRYTCGPSINGGPQTHTLESLQKEIEKQNSDIITVGMEGFSCLFIHREVFENNPKAIKGMPFSSMDWGFAHSCYWDKVTIRVDTQVQFEHLANRANQPGSKAVVFENFYRGIKKPKMVFEPGDGSAIITVKEEDHVAVLPV
jgi:hypothetical protein